ncbi:MAG: hypothetical protein F083_2566 [bacterium F083]|nr:MAG: hypothetical protein F083_2566 [bacterium F083]
MTKKKKFEKPTMQVIELQQRTQILAGSVDAYGMNNTLIEEEEVIEGW